MQRTQILLEDWQYEALKSACERDRKSVSSVIRDLISRHLARRTAEGGLEDIIGIARRRLHPRKGHDAILYRKRSRKSG